MSRFNFRVWDGEELGDIDLSFFEEQGCREAEDVEGAGYILMQSTGLKDKNGTEIFEGDVIRVRGDHNVAMSNNGCMDVQFAVQWMDKAARFNLTSPNYFMETAEVVGNTYENPELLESAT